MKGWRTGHMPSTLLLSRMLAVQSVLSVGPMVFDRRVARYRRALRVFGLMSAVRVAHWSRAGKGIGIWIIFGDNLWRHPVEGQIQGQKQVCGEGISRGNKIG